MAQTLEKRIFEIREPKNSQFWRELFDFQREHNPVYAQWCELMGFPSHKPAPEHWTQIPFLPISFFKNQRVYASSEPAELQFLSSSTTGQGQSRHEVAKAEVYRQAFLSGFHNAWGPPEDWSMMALLPSYLEREGSSLVYMVEQLMEPAMEPKGFFLNDRGALLERVAEAEGRGLQTMLWGVSFALLQLADEYKGPALKHTQIIETGGMKGRGPELTRAELHQRLQLAFGPQPIASEYGMTEMLSQAYSKGNGLFECSPTLEIGVQDPSDPQSWLGPNRSGRLCIIDYANLYSCSFIASDDLGRLHADGRFEVLGRMDQAEIRGCNQLAL